MEGIGRAIRAVEGRREDAIIADRTVDGHAQCSGGLNRLHDHDREAIVMPRVLLRCHRNDRGVCTCGRSRRTAMGKSGRANEVNDVLKEGRRNRRTRLWGRIVRLNVRGGDEGGGRLLLELREEPPHKLAEALGHVGVGAGG